MNNKKIIIANWKMNPQTAEEALRLIKGVANQRLPKNIEVVIAPPFVYLDLIKKNCGKEIKLAAQNVGWAERGAYTGEISGLMLKNLGCSYIIIGHSERRYKMGETDGMINLKLKEALKVGLVPILAIKRRLVSPNKASSHNPLTLFILIICYISDSFEMTNKSFQIHLSFPL